MAGGDRPGCWLGSGPHKHWNRDNTGDIWGSAGERLASIFENMLCDILFCEKSFLTGLAHKVAILG